MTHQNNMTASGQLFAYLSTKPKSWCKAGAIGYRQTSRATNPVTASRKALQTMNWYVYNHA
ncbi:hypothetical protein [Nitrosomonas sp.]|uniref:hypothetical protein n=1 Tax=Nitrosomonas sp. TaxID=42353 RepID=UPI0027321D17|nr:hypothetical protein [Nitrosomonas sp.]MDP1788240.1 hypothetical protein [Nitrosomonas sp.]